MKPKSKSYAILIALILLLLPCLHLFTVKWGFARFFHTEAELLLFLFYNAPLWLLFIAVFSAEFYRTVVLGSRGMNLLMTMSAGGALLAITGILLSPVGPGLWSGAGWGLIVVTTLECAAGALVIQNWLGYLLEKNNGSD